MQITEKELLIKIILIFSGPLGTLSGICRRRTAYLIFSTFQVSFLAAVVPSSPLQLLHVEAETLQGLVVEREAEGEVVVVLDLVVTLQVSMYISF